MIVRPLSPLAKYVLKELNREIDMSRPNIERKANEVATALNEGTPPNQPRKFDPTILITIITTILSLFKNCGQTPQQIEKRTDNPSFLDRFRLKRVIRQNAAHDHDEIEAALLDAGGELTATDAAAMLAEV